MDEGGKEHQIDSKSMVFRWLPVVIILPFGGGAMVVGARMIGIYRNFQFGILARVFEITNPAEGQF